MNEQWTENQGAATCRVRIGDQQVAALRSIVPELPETVVSFRFVPASYLAACEASVDRGVERLLYLQSLIDEEG